MNRRTWGARLLGLALVASGMSAPVRADHLGDGPQVHSTGGYTATDSTEPGGPAYAFVDISETGTRLELGDDTSEWADLPFPFRFFGTDYTRVRISSNGLLSFTGQVLSHGGGQQELPDPEPPNGILAGYWADLDPSAGGVVAYQTMGDSPSRTFVVMYKDVAHWRRLPVGLNEPVRYTFEIVLHEGTTKAAVQFQHVAPDEGAIDVFESGYVSGIEDARGFAGLTYRYGDFTLDEVAVAFEQTEPLPIPPPPSPPPPPIVTTYQAPFVAAGATHLERTGNLPDRHASGEASADRKGIIGLAGSADSVILTADAFPARSDASGWIRIDHTFAGTTEFARVSVRVRFDRLSLKAASVSPNASGVDWLLFPFARVSLPAFARVDGALRTRDGRCAFPIRYDYSDDYEDERLTLSYCEAGLAFVSSPELGGEDGRFLAAPKEAVLDFRLDGVSGAESLYFNLHGLAYADGVNAASALTAGAKVLEATVTEYASCEDLYGEPCDYLVPLPVG